MKSPQEKQGQSETTNSQPSQEATDAAGANKQMKGQQTLKSCPEYEGLSADEKLEFLSFLGMKTFGTADENLQAHLFGQAARAAPDYAGTEQAFSGLTAALRGVGPQDTLEGLLSVQIVTVHELAMVFARKASTGDLPVQVGVNLDRTIKLMQLFASQIEVLSRYRGKGTQRMRVEHVHVHKGGRAIVGPVKQTSTQINAQNSNRHETENS